MLSTNSAIYVISGFFFKLFLLLTMNFIFLPVIMLNWNPDIVNLNLEDTRYLCVPQNNFWMLLNFLGQFDPYRYYILRLHEEQVKLEPQVSF